MKEKKPPKLPKTTPKTKSISGDDLAIWSAAIDDVVPLGAAKTVTAAIKPKKRAIPQDISGRITLENLTVPISSHQPSSFQIDRNLRKKFEKGELPIDGRIDLHGYTVSEAHSRFVSFIARMIKGKARCILVITGKGSTASEYGRGILRRNLPLWCDEEKLKPHILQITNAAPKHGSDGASYILLRRS